MAIANLRNLDDMLDHGQVGSAGASASVAAAANSLDSKRCLKRGIKQQRCCGGVHRLRNTDDVAHCQILFAAFNGTNLRRRSAKSISAGAQR